MTTKRNVRYTLDRKFLTMVSERYRGTGHAKQGPLFKKGSKFYFQKK